MVCMMLWVCGNVCVLYTLQRITYGAALWCALEHNHILTPVTGTASRWHLLKQDSQTHRCKCQHEGQKGQHH